MLHIYSVDRVTVLMLSFNVLTCSSLIQDKKRNGFSSDNSKDSYMGADGIYKKIDVSPPGMRGDDNNKKTFVRHVCGLFL